MCGGGRKGIREEMLIWTRNAQADGGSANTRTGSMATEVKVTETDCAQDSKPDLDRLYKPVGIAAVSAAAICTDKKKSKSARFVSRDD